MSNLEGVQLGGPAKNLRSDTTPIVFETGSAQPIYFVTGAATATPKLLTYAGDGSMTLAGNLTVSDTGVSHVIDITDGTIRGRMRVVTGDRFYMGTVSNTECAFIMNSNRCWFINTSGQFAQDSANGADLVFNKTQTGVSGLGKLALERTITAAGTTGAQTINKIAGTVNFAAAATSVVVTNSLVTTSSIILCVIRTADSTFTSIKSVVPASGSFTITANAAATAETSVGFVVTN